MKDSTTVFVVDPDPRSRDFVRGVAEELGLPCVGYASGEDFLASRQSQTGCLVAEFKLLGIGGIELQEALPANGITLPVLFVVRSADTRQVARAMRTGAITVLDKPVCSQDLRAALQEAVFLGKENKDVAEKAPPKTAIGRDASDQLQQTLDQHRKMMANAFRNSIPELVGEVVHELAQPLSVIANFSAIIDNAVRQEEPLDIDELREWNGGISDASKLAADIIGRFDAFASKRTIHRRMEPLEGIVRESIQMMRFAAQNGRVSVHLEPDAVTTRVDRVQIQQVVINLLKNAIDSLAGNPEDDRTITVRIFSNLTAARIVVSDNGGGVSESDLPSIFEPFLSSKEAGLGLGLAISKGIVESHDGEMWYEPNLPRGASFHVKLPLST